MSIDELRVSSSADAPHNRSLIERVAALEERTTPKPRSPTEFMKEWAGVGTLLIALLYTFPLGVWDRFFVTADQKRAQQIETLRNLALAVSELDAKFAGAYNSIPDEQTRAFFSRAMSSQKAALIERDLPVIQAHYSQLSAPEMIVLAYNLGLGGKVELADKIYTAASAKVVADHNVSAAADIYRLRGQLHASGPKGIDMIQTRQNYSKSIESLTGYASPGLRLQATNSAYEWAIFELSAGDWKCGQTLGAWAITMVDGLPKVSPEVATYGIQYRNVLGRFQLQPNQPQAGCPEELIRWMKVTSN